MTNAQAIFAGAALIAASVIVVNTIRPAEAALNGPYQLMHHSNTTANAGVFRVDTSSGEVSYCYVSAAGDLVCSTGVK
ncbi:MAG: hypothetical protein AB7H77_00405 [Bdellovibrionales bacterium]